MNRILQRTLLLFLLSGGHLLATAQAATIDVPAGGNFQTALNNAQPGDTIVLEAGATFSTAGGFILPNKGSSSQVITIQSSAMAALPIAGYRVHPVDAANMPKLVSLINAAPVLEAAAGAHHYRVEGIEFTLEPAVWAYVIVKLGMGTETNLNQHPHDITLDRCYIHGGTALPGTKRGVGLEGAELAVLNSYISEIHAEGQDSQAIASFNGAGPFQIINNYLEASTENVLFGGSDPSIPNIVPSDIEILNNYFFKPLSWYASGVPWSIKNILEFKNAHRVIVDGNVFENCWQQSQVGFGIVFSPRNQDGNCPWCGVQDVTFSHNITRHTSSGVNMLTTDDNFSSQPLQNITIRDNLFEDINQTQFGGDGRLFQFLAQPTYGNNIHVDHNSAFHTGSGNGFISLGDSGHFANGFSFNDNLVTYGSYGLHTPIGEGTAGLNAFIFNYSFAGNGIIAGGNPSIYPTGNYFPVDLNAVNFVNFSGGDYHLADGSPYKGASTDGKDIGADIDAVVAATCGTISGIPVSACSSYVPPPPPTPPPTGGTLPAPKLNWPAILPVNAQIVATEPPGYAVASFTWSIVLLATGTSVPASVLSRASSANFSTTNGVANLGPRNLSPGLYQFTVTAKAPNGTVSPPARVNVTLVPADFATLRVFPNPWRADRYGSARITFDGLPVNSTLKIFTVSGHAVRTLPNASPLVTWDLMNSSGDKVASGLYLFVITTDDNQKKTGKIVIIK